MVKIHRMEENRIYFSSEEVVFTPMVKVWLPAMPSFPEGYAIAIYGKLNKTAEGLLYLEDLYTMNDYDLTIYHAFLEYLEMEKTNDESIASLHSALVAMVESHQVLGHKIKTLHQDVQGTKELLKLKKSKSRTIH